MYNNYTCIYIQGQTNYEAKQHSTPKAVTCAFILHIIYYYMDLFLATVYVCLSGLWLGRLLHLSFLSTFLKRVCYEHVFPMFIAA